MSHVDEGTLHAYADGELLARQHAEVEAHLSVCAECRARLAEARVATGRAAQLLAQLEPGPVRAPSWRELEERASARGREAPRRSWIKPSLAMAATIVIAFGVGWFSRASWVEVAARPDLTSRGVATQAPAVDRVEPLREAESPAADEALNRGAGADQPGPEGVSDPSAVAQRQPGQAPGEAEAAESQVAGRAAVGKAARTEEADVSVVPTTFEESRAAEPAAAPTEPPADLRQRRQLEADRARRDEAQPRAALAERAPVEVEEFRVPAVQGFRAQTLADQVERQKFAFSVQLEDAAVWLGADVRTLPDLQLVAAEVAPGSTIDGAVPVLPAVRLTYRDATGQSIILDQQWLGGRAGGGAEAGLPSLLVDPSGQRAYRWNDERGYRLILRGTISGDSLRALAGRLE